MSDPKIDKAKGQIKEAVGKVTGDKQLETEGKVEQASATVREMRRKSPPMWPKRSAT